MFSSSATKQTYDSTDSITDSSTSDSDSFTLTTDNDNAAGAAIRNIETINLNVDTVTTAAASPTIFNFAATNITGAKTYNADVVAPISAVSGLTMTGLAESVTVNASDDFKAIDLTSTKAVVVNASAVGTAGTPTTVTTSTGSGSVTVTGAGHLSVAPTNTGLVKATAEKSLTFTNAAATSTVLIGEAKAGNLTVAAGTAAVVVDLKASGDISLTNTGAGSVKAVAGGTITVAGGAASLLTTGEFSSVGNSAIDGDALSSMTISGNGAAAKYTMATGNHAALTDVTVIGSNDVTLVVEADEIAGALNIYDQTTAGKVTVEASGTGAVNTTAGGVIDVLRITGNNNAGQVTVANGQEVTYKVDQTAALLAVGVAANAASQSVVIKLDDADRTTGAVDLTAITITQAKTVTIDASIDTTSGGAANASSVGGITASGANSNVTINTGVNGLTLAGTNTVGTGTLTITGSGAVAMGAAALTATALDASTVTGKISGTGLDLSTVNTVSTGSAADTLTFAGTNASSATVATGAGDDTITLPGTNFAGTANKVSFDLGEGTDTLVFQVGTKLTSMTGGSVTLAGVEALTLAATATDQEINAALLNGATYSIKASAASATGTLKAVVSSSATALDFSKLVLSEAVDSSVVGMTLIADAGSNTGAVTITGATKMKNSIEGGAGADVLTGGALNDLFIYDTDAVLFSADTVGVAFDTVSGGAGNDDTLVVGGTGGTSFTIASTDSWTNITGIEEVTVALGSTARSVTLGTTAETAGIVRLGTSGTQTASTVTLSAAGYTGAVSITGAAFATAITGGAGNDSLTGGAAVDTIVGGAGNDTISGGGENDNISGGAGDDSITLASGTPLAATIAGGDGTDTLTITPGAALTIANTAAFTTFTGIESVRFNMAAAEALSVTLIDGAQDAGIRTISAIGASTGAITLDATLLTVGVTLNANTATTAAASTLTGGSGSDTLNGGSKADSITGNAGVDVITGGDGNDILIGGDGNDIYVFAASGAANDTDVITFVANDRLDFTNFLGSGYSVMIPGGANYTPSSSSTTAVTAFAAADDTAVNVAGKVVVWSAGSAAAAAVAPDATAILAEFGASTGSQAFYLDSGKAVIVAIDIDSTNALSPATAANVYFVDASLDGAAGVSSVDIVLVGTIASHVNPAINLNELAPNGG